MNCFGLGMFLGKTTLSYYALLEEILRLHFSLHGCSILCFSTYLLYMQINISGKCELFKYWRDKSHSARWLQAFEGLVRFVVLSL